MNRLKDPFIAFALCLLAMPASIALTLLATPLWRGLEAATGGEFMGHSGPAEWCYFLTYLVVIIAFTALWSRVRR